MYQWNVMRCIGVSQVIRIICSYPGWSIACSPEDNVGCRSGMIHNCSRTSQKGQQNIIKSKMITSKLHAISQWSNVWTPASPRMRKIDRDDLLNFRHGSHRNLQTQITHEPIRNQNNEYTGPNDLGLSRSFGRTSLIKNRSKDTKPAATGVVPRPVHNKSIKTNQKQSKCHSCIHLSSPVT